MTPGRGTAGLCDACRYARVITSRQARFTRCERSFSEARYPRYPRLPVLTCDGFVPEARRQEPPCGAPPEPLPQ